MMIKTLLGNVLAMGFSADNVVFGSGGALLQKMDRDTFKFAQKAASILVRTLHLGAHGSVEVDEWIGIAKDPVTDPGKKSLEGVLTLARSKSTGELVTARLDQGPLSDDLEDVHVLVYHTGTLYNETTLAEVRERTKT
jgi:nicotinamide phosphoribosyltransferase